VRGGFSQGYLVMDQSGNLYTSTFFGDVIEYSPNGSGGWTGSTIYSFNVSGEGPSPVILDAEGNLYGTFASGGSHGLGFVLELSPSSSGPWTLTDIHDFYGRNGAESAANDAGGLLGGLIFDAALHSSFPKIMVCGKRQFFTTLLLRWMVAFPGSWPCWTGSYTASQKWAGISGSVYFLRSNLKRTLVQWLEA
jgi:hypothetical protein